MGLLFARVVYVNPGNSAREYLFGFTSESTIEGYSIPVIDSTNNHGANLFFRDKYLFSIRYTSNPVNNSLHFSQQIFIAVLELEIYLTFPEELICLTYLYLLAFD